MSRLRCSRFTLFVISLGAAGGWAADGAAPAWPNTFTARLEALALLQTLNAELLGHDSATVTLERWCSSHNMAPSPHIVAVRVRVDPKAPTDEQRQALRVSPADVVHYRHVQLSCGSLVLSEADNWYVPARLTADMNRLLDTTDEPFGKVVRPLGFQRRTLSAELLWSSMPAGWELSSNPMGAQATPLRVPHEVLRHQAILYTQSQQPFSAVVETYTNAIFDFGAWSAFLKRE